MEGKAQPQASQPPKTDFVLHCGMTKEEALKERIALAEARIRAVPASGREILDGPSVHVEKSGLIARAPELGRALVELERWQWAFESWTMVHRPEARELGRAVLIPPKRIDEVVRIRLKGEWSVVDPSRSLEEPVRSQVVSIWDRGPVAEEVPF